MVCVASRADARPELAAGGWSVILVDAELPDSDLLSFVRAELAPLGIPVVALIQAADEPAAAELLRSGATDYVVKSRDELQDLPIVAALAVAGRQTPADLADIRRAMRRRQADLLSIVQTVPDVVYRLDSEGRFIFVSQGIVRYGWQPEELIGRSFMDLVHPDDRHMLRDRMARRLAGEDVPRVVDYRVVSRTGGVAQQEATIDPWGTWPVVRSTSEAVYLTPETTGFAAIGFQGIAHDVTDRMAADVMLRRQGAAIQSVSEGILLLDGALRAMFANAAFEQLTSWSGDDYMGQTVLDWLVTNALQREAMAATLAEGKVWHGRIEVRSHEKATPVEVRVAPVNATASDPVRWMALLHDITDQEALARQVAELEKMQAIGALAGGIAHDFNNILAAIVGHAELAQLAVERDSDAARLLGVVVDAALRGASLVRQIKNFVRRQGQAHEPVELALIVREVTTLLRTTIPPQVHLHELVDRSAGAVLADPSQMHQVLMNLATNAWQAMEEHGGELSIDLRRTTLTQAECARLADDMTAGDYLRVEVGDTGPGMTPDTLSHIFEPLFTTKPPGRGTGIGLAVVKRVVAEHRGAIEVKSVFGEGTRFRVYLPSCPVPTATAADRAEPIPRTRRGRVLVVDDEVVIVQMLQIMLQWHGFETVGCASAAEALALAAEPETRFDLLLINFQMPEVDGPALLDRLRRLGVEAPALLTTGHSGVMDEDRAQALGFAGVLWKPITSAALWQAAGVAVEREAG